MPTKEVKTVRFEIVWDFDEMSAGDFGDVMQAFKDNDTRSVAKLFAKVGKSAPEGWGAVDDPETWAKLPYLKIFRHLVAQFVADFNEYQEKN